MEVAAKHCPCPGAAVIIVAHNRPAARGRSWELRQILLKLCPMNWAELIKVANPKLDGAVGQLEQQGHESWVKRRCQEINESWTGVGVGHHPAQSPPVLQP